MLVGAEQGRTQVRGCVRTAHPALLCTAGEVYDNLRPAARGPLKLHPTEFWEIRFGLSLRGVFRLGDDEALFLFRGTHDDVRRFIKAR